MVPLSMQVFKKKKVLVVHKQYEIVFAKNATFEPMIRASTKGKAVSCETARPIK